MPANSRCDELITRPEEAYRLCCDVVCDLETSRMGAPYIYDISRLRVNIYRINTFHKIMWAQKYKITENKSMKVKTCCTAALHFTRGTTKLVAWERHQKLYVGRQTMLQAAEGKWQQPSPKNGYGLFNNETPRVSHEQYKVKRKHYIYIFLATVLYSIWEHMPRVMQVVGRKCWITFVMSYRS